MSHNTPERNDIFSMSIEESSNQSPIGLNNHRLQFNNNNNVQNHGSYPQSPINFSHHRLQFNNNTVPNHGSYPQSPIGLNPHRLQFNNNRSNHQLFVQNPNELDIDNMYTHNNFSIFNKHKKNKLIKYIIGLYRIKLATNISNKDAKIQNIKSKITEIINSDIDSINDINSILYAIEYKEYEVAEEIISNNSFNINILFNDYNSLIDILSHYIVNTTSWLKPYNKNKLHLDNAKLLNIIYLVLNMKNIYFKKISKNLSNEENINDVVFNLIFFLIDTIEFNVINNKSEIKDKIIELLNSGKIDINYQNNFKNNYLLLTSDYIELNEISLILIDKNCSLYTENNLNISSFYNILNHNNRELLNHIYSKNRTPFIPVNVIKKLEEKKINKYLLNNIKLLLSDFSYFSDYYLNNNLNNFSYETYFIKLFEELINKNIDLINNINTFVNYIVSFIDTNNNDNNIILNSYTKFIFGYIKYLHNYYNKEYLTPRNIYKSTYEYYTEKGNELNYIITNIYEENFLYFFYTSRIHIKYKDSNAYNYGGLLKTFFTNIEEQINERYFLDDKKEKLKLVKGKINFTKSQLRAQKKSTIKSISIENAKNNSNEKSKKIEIQKEKLKNYEKDLEKLNKEELKFSNDMSNLTKKIEEVKLKYQHLDDYFELYILAISKFNRCPIYLKNESLKNIILKKIIGLFDKKITKNIVEKLLLYKIDYKVNKYFTFSEDNILRIGVNKTINGLYNNLKTSNKKVVNKKISINNNLNNSNEDNIIRHINDILIKQYGIYKNLLDFYISHFIDFNINVDTLILNLNFLYESNNFEHSEKKNFEERFKLLLKSLSYDELRLFNLCVSGSYLLQSEYKIQVNMLDKKSLPVFHTCFNQIDINNYKYFEKRFLKINNRNNLIKDKKNKILELEKNIEELNIYNNNYLYNKSLIKNNIKSLENNLEKIKLNNKIKNTLNYINKIELDIKELNKENKEYNLKKQELEILIRNLENNISILKSEINLLKDKYKFTNLIRDENKKDFIDILNLAIDNGFTIP
jgi:hypothetical protein